MNLIQLGAIVTTTVISLGVVLALAPAYTHTVSNTKQPTVLLSFSIVDIRNTPEWCDDLSSILTRYDLGAAVFVTGRVADKHPVCVSAFSSDKIDVGSQTYGYVNLTSIDYLYALDEVRKGKEAVDAAGNLDSKIFKAPFGSTDENIYSLLSRSNITADFSYQSQYNAYQDGKFIRYPLVQYDGLTYSQEAMLELLAAREPVVVSFDNSIPIEQIDTFVSQLISDRTIRVVNASELIGLELTTRGVGSS